MALAESIISSTCNQASISDKHIAQCGPPHSTDMTPGSSYQATRPMTYDSTLSMDEANILLDRYKRLLAPSMPFVVLEDGIDAWSLTHKKPFLMQVIAAVSYFHDLPKQQVMVKDLMRQISEKLMMRNEKSLEVLQGMLILIAWYVITTARFANRHMLIRSLTGTTRTSSGPSNPSYSSISPCLSQPTSTSTEHQTAVRNLDWPTALVDAYHHCRPSQTTNAEHSSEPSISPP